MVAQAIRAAVQTVIQGKPDAIDLSLVALFSIRPRADRGRARRRQDHAGQGAGRARSTCTVPAHPVHARPAALATSPASVSIFNAQRASSSSSPGRCSPTWCSADEINRASPNTQSALLEAMEEHQVTVDGVTLPAADAVHGAGHAEPHRVTRAPTPCRRRSSTGSCCASAIGYPRRAEVRDARTITAAATRSPARTQSPTWPRCGVPRRCARSTCTAREDYLVGVCARTRDSPTCSSGGARAAGLQAAPRGAGARAARRARPRDPGRHPVSGRARPAHRLLLSPAAQLARSRRGRKWWPRPSPA